MKMLLKILILAAAIVALPGCNKENKDQAPLILSTDVTWLDCNQNDIATFTVKQSTEDVTNSSKIFHVENDTPLNGNTFSSTVEGIYSFYAVRNGEKSNTATITVGKNPLDGMEITLIPDSDTIMADNQERVSFQVICNGEENVSSQSELYRVDSLSDHDIRLMEFVYSTDKPGIHEFYAIYQGIQSEKVKITATERPPQIVLSADTYIILADGESCATLSLKINEVDCTSEATYYLISEASGEPIELESNIFTSKVPGKFKIYASVSQGNSNTIEIEAQ